ncbi:MAG TPA: hypothetical protein DEP45_08465 [Armatimonadetes bacterium]|nr:hypothetical protein [Armatimonadota bacterium]
MGGVTTRAGAERRAHGDLRASRADYACGTLLIVTALRMVGWLPGVIAAFCLNLEHPRGGRRPI